MKIRFTASGKDFIREMKENILVAMVIGIRKQKNADKLITMY